MLRFKLDENIPVEAAEPFRDAGHDTSTVVEQNLSGKTDELVSDVCKAEDRALVTLDLDFSDIRAFPPAEFSGIIVLRLSRQDLLNIVNVVSRIVQTLENEPLIQKLWIVDEARVRIRG